MQCHIFTTKKGKCFAVLEDKTTDIHEKELCVGELKKLLINLLFRENIEL